MKGKLKKFKEASEAQLLKNNANTPDANNNVPSAASSGLR